MPHSRAADFSDIQEFLRTITQRLEKVLPGQAPLRDFLHINTLFHYQHLPFPEALDAAQKRTGNRGYLPDTQFRSYYQAGRITNDDLRTSLADDTELNADGIVFQTDQHTIRRTDIYLAALINPIRPITASQFSWQVEARDALRRFQDDVTAEARAQLLANHHDAARSTEAAVIGDLWSACLEALQLEHYKLHPEELIDLDAAQAERMLAQVVAGHEEMGGGPVVDRLIAKENDHRLDSLLARVGPELTLRGLLQALTGQDLLDDMRPVIIRHVGNYLDEGLSAWHHPKRAQGFYACWRDSAVRDLIWSLEDIADWGNSLDDLPDNAWDALVIELKRRGVPRAHWVDYLERVALEMPGWSGMILWRHNHPGYDQHGPAEVSVLDYLAVRLVLERLFASRICRVLWQIEPSLDVVRWYFRHHHAEFLVRHTLYNTRLPEHLATMAQRLCAHCGIQPYEDGQWRHIAHMIWTWRHSPAGDRPLGYSVNRSAWPLFRLAQHLGLKGDVLRSLDKTTLQTIFECLDRLTPNRTGYLWLQAYERHYRDSLFNAVVANHARGPWIARSKRPAAQMVFCMDDREEGIRRHLEEINPQIETLGAAGFFGVAINWRGLDATKGIPLCPMVVTPAHEIHEVARDRYEDLQQQHIRRRSLRERIKNLFIQDTRRNLLSAVPLIAVAAPAGLVMLAGKILAPRLTGRLVDRLREKADLHVPTQVTLNTREQRPALPENPRLGFTDIEQADRVQNFLRNMGLVENFAPLVVMMGHGSSSQNNPHMAAYDCGACSGHHGGPNARVFAAAANRPEIRAILRERGMHIPDDTWFIGAEHNTADESIICYDADLIPERFNRDYQAMLGDLHTAAQRSAHERSRRFASAPLSLSYEKAYRHVLGRTLDFSQARPELGHQTSAAAIIGRRSLSQGLFLDRRVFMVSYDCTQDPLGNVLEQVLQVAGPVVASFLDYYFSTANNDQYGCGTKITHNVVGLFGVMEGTNSDLRTGLARQMIEIHEAMRVQVLIEAKPEIVSAIYERQPELRELIGNAWLLVSIIDPDSGEIQVFKPGVGFTPWQATRAVPAHTASSADWYQGKRDNLEPALIEPPRMPADA